MSVPATLEQNVKERMKAVIGELIPEETWTRVITETTQEFLKKDLPSLIKAELMEYFKGLVLDEFRKPEWLEKYSDSGQHTASDMVQKVIVQNADVILVQMIGGIAQAVASSIRNSAAIYPRNY